MAGQVGRPSIWPRSVRATRVERTGPLPGDELIPAALGALTHAITIRRPSRDVWPWLAQMGAGTRAGWYSYDRIDNGGRPSADRIIPALQDIDVGRLFPARPGEAAGFHVLQVQTGQHLVLGWTPAAAMPPMVTWAFVLHQSGAHDTRLVVRVRAGRSYPIFGLPPALGLPFIRFGHFIMQWRQLLGIAQRAESLPESPPTRPASPV